MDTLTMDKQGAQLSKLEDDEVEIANMADMPKLDEEGRVILVDGQEEVCLNGMHIMAKLFPGTLGRVVPFKVDQLDTDCEYCAAESNDAQSIAA